MIGKHVVIDTLDNFKTKLDLIPSSAIVLIKDVGQIYAHGTYFGAQKTYSLLTKTADGLAPKGGTSASSLIKDGESEWVLTVTNGENPSWRRLPDNAFNSLQYTLPSATTSELGGVKVGQVYTTSFDELVGQYYKINVDKNGLAYVNVPWVNTVFTASGNGITMKDNVFSLSLNSTSKLDSAIGDKIYAVSLDKNGKLCVSVPWVDTNNIFTGATETKNGSSGMVPAPIAKQHNHFLKGDGTWVKPNLSDFTDDVVSGKYLPLTGGELKGTTASVLSINTNVTDDVGIVFKLNGSINKGWVGYSPSIGTYLYNSTSKKYLGIKDDGTLYYSNGTIWHSDNDGSGSGLDADTIDGKHYSDIVNAIGTQLVKYNNSSEGFNQTSAYWVKVATVSPWNGSNRIDFKIEATTGSDSPLVTSFSILKSYDTTGTDSYRGIYITQHDSSTYSSDIGNFNRVIVDASNNIWMYYGKVWPNLSHDILITCKSTYANVKLLSLSEAKATITTTAPVPASSTADFTFDGLYTVIKSKLGKITANVIKAVSGFRKENSSNNYVLLGGGGHELLSTIKELAAKIKVNLSIDNDVEYPLIWSNQNNDTSEHSYLYKSFNLLSYNPKTNTIKAGTFSGNATSASKLNNSVNLWGIEFDGSSDVSGTLSQVNNIYGTAERAPYLYQSAVPTDSGNLGTAIGIGTAPNSYGIFMWGTGDGKGHIQVGRKDATKSSYQLCLLEFGGEVSIGNTAAGHKLTVYGTIFGNQYNASGSLAGAALILNKGGDYFGFGPSGTALSTMSFGSTDYYGKWKTEFMSIVNSGNVGIGKTDPTEKLHVNGNVLADQFIKSGGTSTQFLKADGSVDSTAYVSKSGDTITGKLTITNEGNEKLILNTTDSDNYNLIQFLKDGTDTGYIGTINNDFRIKFEDCPNFYYNGKIVLHLDNYSSYLGYIGTTPVQKDSAALGITGIVRISNKDDSNLYLGNSNNSAWVYTLDIASQSGISYWQIRTNGAAQFASTVTASGFVKKDSSDLYVLLGGGGSKSISSIQESSEKLKITQDNASDAQYPLIWTTENNSESNYSLVYKSYSQLTYNPKTDTLKATNFNGNASTSNKLKITSLTLNLDLNITTEGVYGTSASNIISSLSNKPSNMLGGECRLEVLHCNSSNYLVLLLYALGNSAYKVWHRFYRAGTWSKWIELLNSSNYNSFSPKLDGTGATGSWKIGLKGDSLDTKEKVDALLGKQFLVAYVLNSVLDDFNDGVILATGVGSTYGHHLYLDDNTLAIWHRSRNSGGTAWEAWRKILDSVNYASYALPISGGTIDSKNPIPLIINSTSSNAVEIKLTHNKASKAAFLWDASNGVYMYSYVSDKYISIKDDGTLTFTNKKIWHEDNDGADSGLDADKLDGYHASSFFRSRGWLSAQTDLNTIADNSINSLNGDNGKYTNSPVNYGNLISFGNSDSSYKYGKVQFLTSSSTELYVRNNFNGWKDWKQVAFVDDVPTVTDYYWANVKIKSSEDKTTTPTFGSAIVSGNTKTDTITITNTSGTGHINFSRASYNYITTPASGAIILLPGLEVSGSLGYLFTSTEFRPGVTNTYVLGTSSLQWKGLFTSGSINSSLTTSTHLAGNQGKAIIDSQAAAGSYTMLAKMNSNNGYFTHGTYKDGYTLYYTAKSTVDAGTNTITKTATLLNEDGDSVLSGYANAAGFKRSGSDNNYVLLGGGSHKAISDFLPSGNYAGSDTSGGKAYYSYKLYYASTATLSTKAAIDGFLEAYTFKALLWNGSNAEDNLSTSYPGAGNGTILSGGYSSATYGFQLAIDDDPNWFMALRQRGNGTWSAWKRIPMGDGTGASGTWSINITGNAGSSTVTLRFKLLLTGSATTSKDLNTALSGGGIAANYGYPMSHASGFTNAPSGSLYGCVILFSQANDNLNGLLAWDVNHRGTDSTRYLWWRANDDTGFANAKWHQIAFTDTKVLNASNADVATKLARAEYLESDDAINGFLEANRFKFALFKTTALNQIGMGSYDGMLLSIPWGSTDYGFQMAFDDSTNCVIKARGKAGSWGTWRTLYHTGNLTKVSQLTNDSGYLTSRGYIGTTAVLASSANLDLTGIGWINGGIRLNKANDDCGRMQGLGHGLEFGGPGYAHMNYYFRPHYGTSGSTLTNVYIQNASADSAPTFTTTHSFSSAGNASHSGTVTSTGFIKSGSSNSYVLLGGGGHKTESSLSVSYAASAGNADTVDNYHASSLVKFYLSPLETDAPAASAKTWFTNTMPSKSGAIVYNVPGSEKTIIVGKSSGAYGHMLQLNYDDTYLRMLRYAGGNWKSTDWEKISAGYADSAGYAAKSNVIALTAAAEDACVPSGFDTMQHYRVSSSTTGGADGYIQAYVWNSGKYATQIYYDVDPTNIMALRHRKNEGTWTSWMQICKSSTIRTLTVTSSPGSDANTIYFVT